MGNSETPNRHTDSPDNPGSWGKAGDLSRKDPEALDQMNGRSGGGDSAGGAYPNPHSGKAGKGSGREGFNGHGGQTGMEYHGSGKLGDDAPGENPNSPAEGS